MDKLIATVGDNVRAFREVRGLTLAELASRAGVAKSTLAQIEAASSNPTLGTLIALADALKVRADELMVARREEPMVRIIRRGEGADLSDHAIGAELVDAFTIGPGTAEFHRLDLIPGRREVSASHGAGSREHVIVLSGSVRLGPRGSEEIAYPGDYAVYRGDSPHIWEAYGAEPATIWVLALYPARSD